MKSYLARLLFALYRIFGKKKELTEQQRADAKRFASPTATEKDYLDWFSEGSPWHDKGWSTLFKWVKKHIIPNL